jgi:hypothetical protein
VGKAKPKTEKAAAKAKAKPEKADDEHFEKLNDSDVSSILEADAKESSGAGDILIDDSESLKQDSDLLLDDLG